MAALWWSFVVVLRAIVLFLFSSVVIQVGATTPLENGREALQRDDLAAALKAYQPIGVKDPQWPDKVEDLVRHMLGKKNGLEAWRLLQVGHRVDRFPKEWRDLERMALFHAKACPLSLSAHDEAYGYLMNAAVYRYMTSMFESKTGSLPSDDESISTHLASGVTPYLAEIPEMQLAENRGCRLAKVQVRSKEGAARAELDELSRFLKLDSIDSQSRERVMIIMRALELAGDSKKEKDAKKYLEMLPPTDKIPWLGLPDPERRWLFVKVFGGNRLDRIPAEKRELAQTIARQALMSDDGSPEWLALIDLPSKTAKERVTILSQADKRGPFPARAWMLYELAQALNDSSNPREAMTVLRRLMVEGEETTDTALDDAIVRLAAQIFSQYRFEPSLQGALQASLPARLWNDLLSQSMMNAAVAGQSAEYSRLEKLLNLRRQSAAQPSSPEAILARSLAKRDLHGFNKALSSFKYSSAKLMDFAQNFAAADRTPQLSSFAAAVLKRLRELNAPGSAAEDKINELSVLLGPESDAAIRGGRGVRQGVVHAGVAKWTHPDLRPPTLVLRAPAILPRRELFYVPSAAPGSRNWTFSTAIQ